MLNSIKFKYQFKYQSFILLFILLCYVKEYALWLRTMIILMTYYFTLKIIWIPESESTNSLNWFTWRLKDASSKLFCICPLEKSPKFPPFLAELQSLSVWAIVVNISIIASVPVCLAHSSSWVRIAVICWIASSLDCVITSQRQLEGRRDPYHISSFEYLNTVPKLSTHWWIFLQNVF